MFAKACLSVRESIYGLMGVSQTAPKQITVTNGTGFMVAPGVLATAAHICHVNNDRKLVRHTHFEVICSSQIGQRMETAVLIAEDLDRDLALLRVNQPRNSTFVTLDCSRVPSGSPCGALGFPLAFVTFPAGGRQFNLVERFQGAYVSTFRSEAIPSGRTLEFYETDSLMYAGSSGCPAFLASGQVFALHIGSTMDGKPPQGDAKGATKSTRLAISNWIPATDIREFARLQGIELTVA